jgi:hypothetical protein
LPDLKRRETYEELVSRNKEMHIKKFPKLKEEIEEEFKNDNEEYKADDGENESEESKNIKSKKNKIKKKKTKKK